MTKENFKSNVRNSKEMWLVIFFESAYYDEYSGAKVYDPNLDTDIKSKWRQVAAELKGKVRMGEVWSHSATENLPKLYDVTSFPTILCFPAGDKSDPNIFLKYKGEGVGRLGGLFHFRDITANDIVSWALEKLNEKSIGKSVCTDVNFEVCCESRVSFGTK